MKHVEKSEGEIAKRATKDNETNEGEITYGRKKKENELRQRGRSRKSIVKSANAIDDQMKGKGESNGERNYGEQGETQDERQEGIEGKQSRGGVMAN